MDFTRIAHGSWDSRSRKARLQSAFDEQFDLLIIGGGITGAGIALDAASRGLKVILLEKGDFASGTSGKSTKLIHGGLRYLKQLEFGVVREVGRERSILKKNAPHLVYPENMLLPIYPNGSLGKYTLRAALTIYEALAGVERGERFEMLTPGKALEKEPLLNAQNLIGAAVYKEYRSDDSRLCISVLKTAVEKGALVFNYVKVKDFIKENGQIKGVNACDEISALNLNFYAKVIVNAAGPWVDELRMQAGAMNEKHLMLTRGIHLAFDAGRFPLSTSVYFDVGDGRMIFAIPRERKVYVGTTDINYESTPDEPGFSTSERDYLIEAVNNHFKGIQLNAADIESAWSGLRPLIAQKGKSPSEVSRKDELFLHANGLISIAGGKLTGYRRMAEKVMKEVYRRLRAQGVMVNSKCLTEQITLSGGAFSGTAEVDEFAGIQWGEARQIGADKKTILQWVQRYGKNTEKVVELAYEIWPYVEEKQLVPKLAEILYSITEEAVVFPADFWIRRTAAMYFSWPDFPNEVDRFSSTFMAASPAEERIYKEQEYAFYREIDQMRALRSVNS